MEEILTDSAKFLLEHPTEHVQDRWLSFHGAISPR
jgi:hypothetical protein